MPNNETNRGPASRRHQLPVELAARVPQGLPGGAAVP